MSTPPRIERPDNARLLSALRRSRPDAKALVPHAALDAGDAQAAHGCHPDIVARLWQELHAVLPGDCRYLLVGTPALVRDDGLILAIAAGTMYGLRIPTTAAPAARQAGAQTVFVWNDTRGFDIAREYGSDWVIGAWLAPEADWLRAMHDCSDGGAPSDFEDTSPTADFAAIAASRQQTLIERLDAQSAAGDLDARFQLFQMLWNASMKQRSAPLLERADGLLASAAAQGHAQAIALSAAWPRMKAETARKISQAT